MKVFTPWFKGTVKPVRIGVYQRKFCGRVCYSYWTGSFWDCLFINAQYADWAKATPSPSVAQELRWRGRTSE